MIDGTEQLNWPIKPLWSWSPGLSFFETLFGCFTGSGRLRLSLAFDRDFSGEISGYIERRDLESFKALYQEVSLRSTEN